MRRTESLATSDEFVASWSRLAVLSATVLLFALPLAAQTHRATLRGAVVDPTNAPVPAAVVRVINVATGESRSVSAESGGRFAVPELAAGTYRIEVEQPGHKKYVVHIDVQVGQELWLDVGLELGNVSEEIVVSGASVPLDRESPALGSVIDGRQISGLPLDGRNFLELSLLAPGAAPAPEGSASSLRGDFAFSVNGGREDAQSFVLDGFYNIDPKLNTPGVRPPVDGIREFKVVTSTYDASFGRNSAGQINVVTHSGTNQVRGTGYGFFRSQALDARNYFAPENEEAPDYSRQQFGGSVGGPIVRNKTFFFADYERTRLREGITQVTNVPTLAERNGDFSNSQRTPPVNPFTGQPFPGNQIPVFFQNPVGRAIAALYPLPNRDTPFANFVSSPTLRDDVDQFDGKVDHGFANGSALTTRYSFSDRRLYEPFPSTVSVPGYGTDVPRRAQNLGVGLTQPFGGTLINEARVGYSRVAIGVFHENRGTSLNQQVGLPELSSNPRDFGLSQITINGYSPLGDEFTSPQESATDMFQVLDTVTWTRGAHLVKAGAEIRHVRQSAYRDVQSRGFLNFTDLYVTGNGLADLLLGFPTVTGGALLDNPQNLRSSAWSAFAQDSWRVRPNLTLSAGVRYEYIAPAVDADDRATLYDVATGQLVQVGTNGMPRGGYDGDRNNFAPRVGFAWTPDQAGQMAIRGGYGLYYNQGALATGEGLYFNAPYFDLNLYVPFPGVPPVTLQNPFPAFYPIEVPISATAYERDLQTGWLEHWNVSAQRQLGGSRAVEVAYVGSRGHDLVAARDLNQAAASPNVPNLRPNPFFGDITLIESRGSSNYHALQLKFQQRLERGLSFFSTYTLGKSEDDASGFFSSTGDPNFPQDSQNPEAERARSSFDVRHRFSLSFAWQLPFGAGRRFVADDGVLSSILADMELQGIVTLQSGRPFTVALLPEFDNSNTGRSTLGFGANDRPNVSGDASLADPTADRWFDTAAFSVPAFGRFGNAGRNILDGPGYSNVNIAFLKFVSLGSSRLELRAEAFNLFNRANFNLPDAFVGSPTFGRIVSADSPRRCQFGVRVSF